jgi:hypothetical protein
VEIVNLEELLRAPKIGLDRGRTAEKREKDLEHLNRRQQIAKVFKEAYRDKIDSLGEVDVDKNHDYPALRIRSGDVLRDPKLRMPFSHPFLGGEVKIESRPKSSPSARDRLREFGIEHGFDTTKCR